MSVQWNWIRKEQDSCTQLRPAPLSSTHHLHHLHSGHPPPPGTTNLHPFQPTPPSPATSIHFHQAPPTTIAPAGWRMPPPRRKRRNGRWVFPAVHRTSRPLADAGATCCLADFQSGRLMNCLPRFSSFNTGTMAAVCAQRCPSCRRS